MASSPVKVFPTVTNRCMQNSVGLKHFLYCSTHWRLGVRTSRQIQIGLISPHLGASTLWFAGRCYLGHSVCPFRFSLGQVHRPPGSGGQVTRPKSHMEPERCMVPTWNCHCTDLSCCPGPPRALFFLPGWIFFFFFDKFTIYVLLLAQNITVTPPRLSEKAASCGNALLPAGTHCTLGLCLKPAQHLGPLCWKAEGLWDRQKATHVTHQFAGNFSFLNLSHYPQKQ